MKEQLLKNIKNQQASCYDVQRLYPTEDETNKFISELLVDINIVEYPCFVYNHIPYIIQTMQFNNYEEMIQHINSHDSIKKLFIYGYYIMNGKYLLRMCTEQ